VQTINVELGDKSYPIHIGPDLLTQVGLLAPLLGPTNVVVTDSHVAPLYLTALQTAVGDRLTDVVVLPEGEVNKNIEAVMKIIDTLTLCACGRDTMLLALGGGVIGDVTGLAAAIYLRGVDFIQLPTTLLAQVDASVGGKTAVNHERGKNLIGAFHQPRCVVSDIQTLRSLDQRQFRSGIAEVIKHALIADLEFFDWLEANMQNLLQQKPAALKHAIARCCEIKAGIVAHDEKERGPRALLNLGHTFAHAIECDSAYSWLHGEAVAAGLILASRLSQQLGFIERNTVERVRDLTAAAGLPVRTPEIPPEQWRAWMRMDKKSAGGKLRFVLLDAIGKARLEPNVPQARLDEVLLGAHL